MWAPAVQNAAATAAGLYAIILMFGRALLAELIPPVT